MIFTYMASLVECLKQQQQEMLLPEMCFLAVVPGEAAAADYMGDCEDKNGMGWVRLITTYPTTVVGQPDTTPGNCAKAIGADIEIGVIRMAPTPDEQGNLPTEDEQNAISSLVVDDMLAMIKAISCCDVLDPEDVVTGPWTPLGPEGGVTGGVVILSAAF
jgi:hypothetical protein